MTRSAFSLVASCLACLVLVTAPVSAGTIRHDLTHTPYLALGDQPEYRSTGAVYVGYDLGIIFGERYAASQVMASGVLIAPDWVLTAGHVVDGLYSGMADGLTDFGFVPGEQDPTVGSPYLTPPGSPYHEIDFDRTVSHPLWDGDLTKGYDIALIHLSTPVTGITPAVRYTGTAEVGKVGTYVGYGMRGTGLTGMLLSDELRRAGNNMLDLAGGNNPTGTGGFDWASDRIVFSDFDDPGDADGINLMGTASLLALEYSIASGDSGGPLFVDFPDDGMGPLLVGINSFVGAFGPGDPLPGDNTPNSSYGDFVGATRVAAFNSWIDGVVAVPEPATATLLLLAGGVAMLRRRGRC